MAKTTIDIPDALLAEAKEVAARKGTTLRALVASGLRSVIDRRWHGRDARFRLRDASVDGRGLQPEFRGADLGSDPRRDVRRSRRVSAVDTNLLVYPHVAITSFTRPRRRVSVPFRKARRRGASRGLHSRVPRSPTPGPRIATSVDSHSSARAIPSSADRSRTAGIIDRRGRLAQLGEHQLDKLGVTGSSPVPPI